MASDGGRRLSKSYPENQRVGILKAQVSFAASATVSSHGRGMQGQGRAEGWYPQG